MRFLPFFMFFFVVINAYAQDLNFESEVKEAGTLNPVADVIVTIEGTTLVTKTNEEGQFSFDEMIPFGEYTVTLSKDNYETKYFLIKSQENVKILIDYIEIEITKDEANRRKKNSKAIAKEEKRKLKEAQKIKEERDKILRKQTKKLQKENTVDVTYGQIIESTDNTAVLAEEEEVEEEDVEVVTEVQLKYAKILGVSIDKVANKDLYETIDEWMGTTYLWGGETKEGVDCSAFSQLLSMRGFDRFIERTAKKQYESKNTEKFTGIEHLAEGDLIFFKGFSKDKEYISHVGIYLHNNKFVHATGSKYGDGFNGVKISDITDPYWMQKFVSAGRRLGGN